MGVRTDLLAAALTTACAIAARAQGAPSVRSLEAPDAVTAPGVVTSITGVRALSNGLVLVNDRVSRRVVLLDAQMRVARVVADSSSATGRLYGPYNTALLPFRGDSTLFLSVAGLSMTVIDPRGKPARVVAPPRPGDFGQLLGGANGNPGLDAKGRLVYRAPGISIGEQVRLSQSGRRALPDSVALVRFDFTTRHLDTAAFVRVYTPRVIPLNRTIKRGDTSFVRTWLRTVIHPAPTVDDWAILANGGIAIVRGRDYHVDFIDRDTHLSSGPRIPFAWRHLADSDKVALIDSAKALRARLEVDPIGAPSARVVTGNGPAGDVVNQAPPEDLYVDPDEIPDYQPVFASGAVHADADGHLWVRTVSPVPSSGGAVYDVIDGRGHLLDEVEVPRNTAIAGFAAHGVVFLARREAKALVLERIRHQLPESR